MFHMETTNLPNEKLAHLEALLFIHGEPLALKKIAALMEIPPADVPPLLDAYRATLAEAHRGLALISDDEKVQLVTQPQFASLIDAFLKNELAEDLSLASLETLAIIAYFGPLSRSRIDYQRGVNSSFILRSLLIRGLIERFSDPDHPHSFLYRPSFELMKHLGVTKREELPEYERFATLLTSVEAQQAAEPEIVAAVAAADQAPTDAIVQNADEPPPAHDPAPAP